MINLTNEQKAVVNAPIGNMLVSAAAGSGKTSVLVERILTKLIQGAFNIDDILVVTFTRDAATNMQMKIDRAIRQRITGFVMKIELKMLMKYQDLSFN